MLDGASIIDYVLYRVFPGLHGLSLIITAQGVCLQIVPVATILVPALCQDLLRGGVVDLLGFAVLDSAVRGLIRCPPTDVFLLHSLFGREPSAVLDQFLHLQVLRHFLGQQGFPVDVYRFEQRIGLNRCEVVVKIQIKPVFIADGLRGSRRHDRVAGPVENHLSERRIRFLKRLLEGGGRFALVVDLLHELVILDVDLVFVFVLLVDVLREVFVAVVSVVLDEDQVCAFGQLVLLDLILAAESQQRALHGGSRLPEAVDVVDLLLLLHEQQLVFGQGGQPFLRRPLLNLSTLLRFLEERRLHEPLLGQQKLRRHVVAPHIGRGLLRSLDEIRVGLVARKRPLINLIV